MPAKNKQQKNAFYFYMQELLPELKREGRVFPGGMADVVPIAHPRWKVCIAMFILNRCVFPPFYVDSFIACGGNTCTVVFL